MEMKQCRQCHRVKEETSFKLIKGKYRSGKCHTCLNGSRQTMADRSAKANASRVAIQKARAERMLLQLQETKLAVDRANLFLRLWNTNHPYDVCLAEVERVYGEQRH